MRFGWKKTLLAVLPTPIHENGDMILKRYQSHVTFQQQLHSEDGAETHGKHLSQCNKADQLMLNMNNIKLSLLIVVQQEHPNILQM